MTKTIVFAHPDDEVIYFWPLVFEGGNNFICVFDGNYRGRGEERRKACKALLERYHNTVQFLDYPDLQVNMPLIGDLRRLLEGDVYTHAVVDFKGSEHIHHLLCAAAVANSTERAYYWGDTNSGKFVSGYRECHTGVATVSKILLEYYPKETGDYLLYNNFDYTLLSREEAFKVLNACDRLREHVFEGLWEFGKDEYEIRRIDAFLKFCKDNIPPNYSSALEIGPGVDFTVTEGLRKVLGSVYTCGKEPICVFGSVYEVDSSYDLIIMNECIYYLDWREREYVSKLGARRIFLAVDERDEHLVWDSFGARYNSVVEEEFLGTVKRIGNIAIPTYLVKFICLEIK
jgi:hypothetical protein